MTEKPETRPAASSEMVASWPDDAPPLNFFSDLQLMSSAKAAAENMATANKRTRFINAFAV
jgi:hypothetical protein